MLEKIAFAARGALRDSGLARSASQRFGQSGGCKSTTCGLLLQYSDCCSYNLVETLDRVAGPTIQTNNGVNWGAAGNSS